MPAPAFTSGSSDATDSVRVGRNRRAMAAWVRSLGAIPRWVLLGAIRGYQRVISPLLPVVTLGRCGCRFAPTCSHYAAEAIQVHGALRGSLLAMVRLLKCTPLHPGGLDPVPPRRLVCRRVDLPHLTSGSLPR